MSRRPVAWPLLPAIMVSLPGYVLAQAPPDIDALRGETAIGQADRERIGLWVASRLDEIKDAVDRGDMDRATGTIREILSKTSRASPDFHKILAEEVADHAAPMMTDAGPVVARLLAKLLRDLNHLGTLDGLLAALRADDVQVRYFAATGLARLGDRISVEAPKVLTQLEQAADAEPHPLVRQEMLSAMLLPNRMEESLTTVCSALMASLPRLDGAAAPQLRPETLLMQKLAEATTNVRAAEQRSRAELARALAAQLAKAVRRYVAGGDEGDDQRALEVRILSAEDALRTVIRPEIASGFPDVAGVMQAGGPDAVAKMQAELGKWVGSQDSKGLLNAPPWDVPVGGLPEAKSSP